MKLSAHARGQLARLARLVITTAASSAAVVDYVHAAEVRYPLIGILVGLVEVGYRELVPTAPVPFVTSQPDRPTETAPPKD